MRRLILHHFYRASIRKAYVHMLSTGCSEKNDAKPTAVCISAEQLRQRSAPPSTLTLHGLVRHMAEVERDWFRICFAGQAISHLYSTEAWPTADFDDLESADPATDFATFAEEVRRARAVTVGRSLDDTFVHPYRDMEINLRWVYVHMIEEYARHNGHADLLRERIDGVTGARWGGE
jgi:Protein of unknown function (DUF664)